MKTLFAILAAAVIALTAAADEPLKKSDFDLVKDVQDLKQKVEEHDRLLDALIKKDGLDRAQVDVGCKCGDGCQCSDGKACKCKDCKCGDKCPGKVKASLAAACAVWQEKMQLRQMSNGGMAWTRIGGSGTVVACELGKSLVVTNKHVVQDGDGRFSISNGGKNYPGRLLTTDDKADLAVIVVDAELPVAPLALDEPKKGTKVIQWGCDSRGNLTMVEKQGEVVGVMPRIDNMGDLLTTIEAYEGDSGSAIFNFEGRVVGVTWAKTKLAGDRPGEACVRLGDVVRFLRGAVRDTFPRLTARLDAARSTPDVQAANPATVIKYDQARGMAKDKNARFILAIGETPRSSVEFYGQKVYVCNDPPEGTEPGHYQCGDGVWWKSGWGVPQPMPATVIGAALPQRLKWYSYIEGQKLAAETGKSSFVLFTSPENCVFCKQLEAGALKNAEVLKELEKFVCIKVDVTTPAGQQVLSDYAAFHPTLAVTQWPTMEVYIGGKKVGGNESGRLIGNVSAASLLYQLQGRPQQQSVLPPSYFLNCGPTG